MAFITVSNTFTNSTTADATQVNTNFTDIINGTSDGTKDFSIAALTLAGTFTANGNVNIGNASSDDVTITGSLAASIPVKTNTSFDFGSATLGLRYIYMGGTSTFTARIGAATLSASRLYTIPEVSADASFVMTQGAQTIAGAKTFSGQLIGAGTATNDNAAAGYIGEFVSSIAQTATTAATNVWKDVASITLSAGDWDISGGIVVANSGATLTRLYVGVNNASGDTAGDMYLSENYFEMPLPAATRDCGISLPTFRRSISGSTTYYIKVKGTYTVSDIDATASIWARRVR